MCEMYEDIIMKVYKILVTLGLQLTMGGGLSLSGNQFIRSPINLLRYVSEAKPSNSRMRHSFPFCGSEDESDSLPLYHYKRIARLVLYFSGLGKALCCWWSWVKEI